MDGCRVGALVFCVLRLVLCDEVAYSRCGERGAVFWVQCGGVRGVWAVDGDGGVFDGVWVCEEDLWVCFLIFLLPFLLPSFLMVPSISHSTLPPPIQFWTGHVVYLVVIFRGVPHWERRTDSTSHAIGPLKRTEPARASLI